MQGKEGEERRGEGPEHGAREGGGGKDGSGPEQGGEG